MKIKISDNKIRQIIRSEMSRRALREQDEGDLQDQARAAGQAAFNIARALESRVDKIINLLDFPVEVEDLIAANEILIDVVEEYGPMGLGIFNASYGIKEWDPGLFGEGKRSSRERKLIKMSPLQEGGPTAGIAIAVLVAAAAAYPVKYLTSKLVGFSKSILENMSDQNLTDAIRSTTFISKMKRDEGNIYEKRMLAALDLLTSTIISGDPPSKSTLLSLLRGVSQADITSLDDDIKALQVRVGTSSTGEWDIDDFKALKTKLRELGVSGAHQREILEDIQDNTGRAKDLMMAEYGGSWADDSSIFTNLSTNIQILSQQPEAEDDIEVETEALQEGRKIRISRSGLSNLIGKFIVSETSSRKKKSISRIISEGVADVDLDEIEFTDPGEDPEIAEPGTIEDEPEAATGGGGRTATGIRRIEQLIGHPSPDGGWDPATNQLFYDFVKSKGAEKFAGVIGKEWRPQGAAAAGAAMGKSYGGTVTGMVRFLEDITEISAEAPIESDEDVPTGRRATVVRRGGKKHKWHPGAPILMDTIPGFDKSQRRSDAIKSLTLLFDRNIETVTAADIPTARININGTRMSHQDNIVAVKAWLGKKSDEWLGARFNLED